MEPLDSKTERLVNAADVCIDRFLRAYELALQFDKKFVVVDDLLREEYIRLKSRSLDHDLFISRPAVDDIHNPYSFSLVKAPTDIIKFEMPVPLVVLRSDPAHFYTVENELITGILGYRESSTLIDQINYARVIPIDQR